MGLALTGHKPLVRYWLRPAFPPASPEIRMPRSTYRHALRQTHAPEVIAAIIERYDAGASLDDIGLELGVSGWCVGNRLRAAGVTIRGKGGLSDCLRFVPQRDRKWRPDGDGAAA